ncbi:hypothetical protein B1A99_15770 [Cohnella sp. CIP 111063]|uniref:DUF5696 domain-containing protein n=1 Tax=unclassified Cohnella TaxID=2636738 RepID=UPI000B8C18FB|nr:MULTISPECIES: DUF5696 domain-containing protein [unclassified Cohnella]OXS58082.1 hypothetical protein B1A99_15770 [Cohnella sp. CIP 111063]PRX71426.1 hypothetical protein B0G52_109225 [Cohnella sp. SGD-V74]
MLRKLWPSNGKYRLLLLFALIVVVAVASIVYGRRDKLPSLQAMGIAGPVPQFAPVLEGTAWQAGGIDGEGFALAGDSAKYSLLLEPKTSQLVVLDKTGGYKWRSNPSPEQLKQETVKGALLENLQSPFVAEVVVAGQTRRTMLSTLTKGLTIDYVPIGDAGVQATYTYEKEKLSFVIQFTVTDRGLEAAVPSDGIRESGDYWLYSLQLLPYFGAVPAGGEEGYLFVPDGPGGLILYDRQRPSVASGYEFPIYGDDPAHVNYDENMQAQREQIAYPLYGLRRGDRAFAAIVKEGAYTAKIKAVTPSNSSRYHSIGVSFGYREEYGRKVSGITKETVKAVRKERTAEDRRVEYRLLSGEEADYVGMAHTYRDYLQESGQLGAPLAATDRVPLMLSIIGGGNKPQFGRSGYEAATTFEQAERIVRDLREAGVANMSVIYQGWQNSGHTYTDKRFPIVSELGGEKGARRFAQSMRELGVPVLFDDYMAWKDESHSSFYKKTDGIRGIDSTVLSGTGDAFIVNPVKAVRQQKLVVDALKKIGIDGIHYVDGPGSIAFSDYRSNAPLTRGDTVHYYRELLDYVREQLGTAGVQRGEQYALGHADYIEELPHSSSRDFIVDETVPVYQIAVHGTVAYSTAPGNLRDVYEDEMLRAIEYGAIPSFTLTYAESRVLKGTDYQDLFSTEYAVWKDRILEDYDSFDRLAGVLHQPIADHEKAAEGVYVTTYEDGTRVTVDYNTKQFGVEGGRSE